MLKAFTAVANSIRTAVGGILQIVGPSAGSTRTMTTPDADFTAARTDAAQTFAGRQTFGSTISVGNATPSTSGAGITFPATQSASSDANTLDDYEEGSWTPLLSDGTNNATMNYQTVARYTKVGNLVTLQAYVQTDTLGSVSGAIRITGVPFNSSSANYSGSVAGYAQGLAITAGQSVGLYIPPSSAYIDLRLWDDVAGTTQMQSTEWSADGGIIFETTYRV